MKLSLLKSERRHKKGYICPKTGFKITAPTEGCIKCIEEAAKREEILFVSVDKYLLEFARSKLKEDIYLKDIDN